VVILSLSSSRIGETDSPLSEISASGMALSVAAFASAFSFALSVAVRSARHSEKLSGMASPSRDYARIWLKTCRGRR